MTVLLNALRRKRIYYRQDLFGVELPESYFYFREVKYTVS
jgi:hypothetical protein